MQLDDPEAHTLLHTVKYVNPMKVVVMGQGYVGLPLAMQSVLAGHWVTGFDVDESRVKRLQAAQSYVEDVSDLALLEALASGRYQPSNEMRSCAGFDVAVITVPTPLRDGNPDISYVIEASRTLARFVRPGSTIVLESTTYPGTTEEIVAPILEEGSGLASGIDFFLGYSPERIDPGNPTWTLTNTPKVVAGVNGESLARVRAFYDSIVDQTIVVSGTREAELTKLIENTFRHVNIALVNELAMFAADLGIDVWEAIRAATTKPFGFMPFFPGPGVGGHCLPIDPSYLSWRVRHTLGRPFRFVELANEVNLHMPAYVVGRVASILNNRRCPVHGSRVLLLGLSYKRNTGDARESPARSIARLLTGMGAQVRAADPHVLLEQVDEGVELVPFCAKEIAHADVVVLLVDHDSFDPSVVIDNAQVVFDTKNFLPRVPNVERL